MSLLDQRQLTVGDNYQVRSFTTLQNVEFNVVYLESKDHLFKWQRHIYAHIICENVEMRVPYIYLGK